MASPETPEGKENSYYRKPALTRQTAFTPLNVIMDRKYNGWEVGPSMLA